MQAHGTCDERARLCLRDSALYGDVFQACGRKGLLIARIAMSEAWTGCAINGGGIDAHTGEKQVPRESCYKV